MSEPRLAALEDLAETIISLAAFLDGDAVLDDLARRAREALATKPGAS